MNTISNIDYRNFHMFVGTYVNDHETQREVEEVTRQHANVTQLIVPHPGPTCRADCLDWIVRGIRDYQKQHAIEFAGIILHDVPVFSNVDGHASVFMVREIINAAFRELGRNFTPEEIDAIDAFGVTAQRLQFETRLEPGEACFLNNYTVMHARSEFDHWEEPKTKRLMLRLWLDVERKARHAPERLLQPQRRLELP